MTRSILAALAAATILMMPLALQAQTKVPEKCAALSDPAERAACIRAETGR